jgi:hypothetical protein
MKSMWRTFVVGMAFSFAVAGVSIAADPDRGSTTAPSPSGQEGAEIGTDRSAEMGGMERGETSLKQEQREKEDIDLNKDKEGGKDPLEQQEPGPGTSRSGGGGAGQ